MALPPIVVTPISIQTPLRPSSRGTFVTNDTTVDAVANDLKDLILTNYGERVIQYDFGANLRPLIFEQDLNIEQKITDAITSAAQKWIPLANILNIDVQTASTNSQLTENSVQVSVTFTVGNTDITGNVSLIVRG